MQDSYLRFEGLNAPIRVVGCESLLDNLPRYFPTRPYQRHDQDPTPPFATLVETDGTFHLVTFDGGPSTHSSEVNAVCDLIATMSRRRAFENPTSLCLHAASVKIGGGLVVFPATRRAGKSTLAAALATKGVEVYGDDILPIATEDGMPISGLAGGTSPRLRLPVPETAPQSMHRFLQSNPGPENRQYRYIPSAEVAAWGEQAPITAFVHLERVEGRTATLTPLSRGLMLKLLMKQNFAREGSAQHILAALYSLAAHTTSWSLSYDDLDDASDLLIRSFSDVVPPEIQYKTVSVPAENAYSQAGFDPKVQMIRHPEAALITLDGEAFAATRDMTRILHANAGVQRIWALLEEPTSAEDAIEILCAAFPDQDAASIKADTLPLFKTLLQHGLTIPANSQAVL